MTPKRPAKTPWLSEFTLVMLLKKIEAEADPRVRDPLIYQALKEAAVLGYQAGFTLNPATRTKVAFIDLPAGRVAWGLPPQPQDPDNRAVVARHFNGVSRLRTQ